MVKKKARSKAKSRAKKSGKVSEAMSETLSTIEVKNPKKVVKRTVKKQRPETMSIAKDRDIASDFAIKVVREFDQMIKSVVMFGSTVKHTQKKDSDIDIVIIIDDVAIAWDEELIAWYREELAKIIKNNPYVRPLHVNSIKLSTWWEDILRGDPVVLNVLRYGEALIDYGGFFNPLRLLLKEGKIKSTPEAIYTLLQRAPHHLTRARQSMLATVDGLYWVMVDSAHAALIAEGAQPPSPEAVSQALEQVFVRQRRLKSKFIDYYNEVHGIAKGIIHGTITHFKGEHLDDWFEKTDKFLGEMVRLVDESLHRKK